MSGVYLHGNAIILSIPLIDVEGAPIVGVTGISYRLFDQTGAIIYSNTADSAVLASSGSWLFVSGETASLSIDPTYNTLAAGETQGMRLVELICTTPGGTRACRVSYLIEAGDVLVVGVNSHQALIAAEFQSLLIPGLTGWAGATVRARTTAMMEAYRRIGRLHFPEVSGYGQDSYFYADSTPRKLNDLTPTEYMLLSEKLRSALAQAQVIEANHILSGGEAGIQRATELLAEKTGESSMSYRPGRPLILALCNEAMRALTGHISYSVNMGRA